MHRIGPALQGRINTRLSEVSQFHGSIIPESRPLDDLLDDHLGLRSDALAKLPGIFGGVDLAIGPQRVVQHSGGHFRMFSR